MANGVVNLRPVKWVFAPSIILILGLAGVWLLFYAETSLWVPSLYFLVGLTAWVAWRNMRWPDAISKYWSFGAMFLLVCVVQRVLYSADFMLSGPAYEGWPVYSASPQRALLKGELLTLVGMLLTILAWQLLGGMRISPAAIFQDQSGRTRRMTVILYIMALAGLGVSKVAPNVSALFGQALPTLAGLGLITAVLLSIRQFRGRFARLGCVMILSLPYLLIAISAGMKETLILALLPAAVLLWMAVPNILGRVTIVSGASVLLALVTAFVGYTRAENWYSDKEKSSGELVEGFATSLASSGAGSVLNDGIKTFLARSNGSAYRGWAVAVAEERGSHPELVFWPLTYVFIPRILWPDKPLLNIGQQYSGVVFGERYTWVSSSSTAIGLYSSFYLGGAWLGWIIGSVSLGALLAFATKVARRVGGAYFAGVFGLSLVPYVLKLDEVSSVGAITTPIISLAYMTVILMVLGLFEVVFRPGAAR